MTEGFLSRWSKLKQTQVTQSPDTHKHEGEGDEVLEEASVSHLSVTDEESVTSEQTGDQADDKAVLTDEDMPDLETISAKTDMSAFFSSGVSAELKRQALKKYFHQPEFNFRDPLDEYNLDYSQPVKLTAALGEKVRGWAEKQMQDAMQEARATLNDEVMRDAAADKVQEAELNQEVDFKQESDDPDLHEQSTQQETK